jgi:hypothetical protein
MYDITDPISPVLEGRYLVYARSLDVAKWGNYVYTREYNGGFRIFDISDPAEPFGMGYYDTDDYTHEIQIDNGTLFLGDGFQGTLIFSLTDPANPMLLSAIDGLVLSMFTSDSLLFIGNSGIDMYNISDPSNPVLLGQYAGTIEDHYYRKIISYGDYVYAAEDDSGNCVYDFSDPDNPSKISCFDSVVSRDFFIQDTLLFSSDQIEGMKIFDIGDPNSPDLLSTTPPDQAYSVCAYGDYAYLVYKNDPDIGFRTFDITVPSYPVLVGTFDNFGSYNGVYAENDTAYVAAGEGGLWILRHRAPTDIRDDNYVIPTSLSLENYPNPFNASTTIRYTLPNESEISLSIYNLLGQRVEVLFEGAQDPGEYIITWDSSHSPSGIYFARLETRCQTENVKMVLLK